MDPIAIASSALKILNQVKEQLRECEEAFAQAREFNKAIQIFEVTINMIPNKAASDSTQSESALQPNENIAINTGGIQGTVMEYGVEMGRFASEKTAEALSSAAENTPIGLMVDLFKIGENGEPIFDEGPSPAETLRDMKLKVENGLRVHSDLDVMFMGMGFIIRSALQALSEATDTLQQMSVLGTPSCWWVVMPWKIAKTKALQEELCAHKQTLAHQTQALQSAIGVASYAVQLEQLEK